MSDHKVAGTNGDIGISQAEDGGVVITAKMDSHADAVAAAEALARGKRAELTGLDKLLSVDEAISPKARASSVVLIRVLAIAFVCVLGLVIGITSGHAAVYIFPDAPMPDWLLFMMGFITVPGGIWAADELMKTIRDDIDDKEQRVRKLGLIATITFCLLFDSIGVITTRVASSSGALQQVQNNKSKAEVLKQQISSAANELFMLEPPLVPSTSYVAKINALLTEPTLTGKPVQTVGELKDRCAGNNFSYCFEYQKKFAKIDNLLSEYETVKQAERRKPELEALIVAKQGELEALQTVGSNEVDDFFAQGEGAEREDSARKVRFWRTMIISIGQVFILAILVLLLLDDRHDRMQARRDASTAKGA